jgi:hypothetical protein
MLRFAIPSCIFQCLGAHSPPQQVKMVFEALCALKKVSPARVPKGDGSFVEDFWYFFHSIFTLLTKKIYL